MIANEFIQFVVYVFFFKYPFKNINKTIYLKLFCLKLIFDLVKNLKLNSLFLNTNFLFLLNFLFICRFEYNDFYRVNSVSIYRKIFESTTINTARRNKVSALRMSNNNFVYMVLRKINDKFHSEMIHLSQQYYEEYLYYIEQ